MAQALSTLHLVCLMNKHIAEMGNFDWGSQKENGTEGPQLLMGLRAHIRI
jgi:hypothetical protein